MAADNEDFQAPIVRDLTPLTGAGKNEHRRTVIIGYAANRAILPMLLAAAVTFALTSILFLPLGQYWFVGSLLATTVVMILIFYRVKKSMNQRAYKAIRDYLDAHNGHIFIDGQPVLEPQLVYHQPLYLDRDPDELRDVDVAYVAPSSPRRHKARTWMNQDLNKHRGKARR